MINLGDNVLTLPGREWTTGEQADQTEVVRAAVWRIDELIRRLRLLSPRPAWSAGQWMIASTPFRMRLPGARRCLGELTTAGPAYDQADIDWFLELKGACLEAKRYVHDIDVCLDILRDKATSTLDRKREAETFTSTAVELLEAVCRVRELLTRRFPAQSPGRDVRGVLVAGAATEPLREAERLKEAEGRLLSIARMCEERPSAIDGAALHATDMVTDAHLAVEEAFHHLHAEVNDLRFDSDIREALQEQRDEFAYFYRSALGALEIYREILRAYHALKRASASPQPGELQRIREDERVHIEERDLCIRAFSEFQSKFSAMIAIL